MEPSKNRSVYERIFDRLEIPKLLGKETESRERLTEEEILNTIFYSSFIEGNRLSQDAAKALINDGFVELGGRLSDYIELINHKKIYEAILEFDGKKITRTDVIRIHNLLFEGVIGSSKGVRESATSVGSFLAAETGVLIEKGLDDAVGMLNKEAVSSADAFANAVDFHLKYVHIHPFNDGNGRTVRLFLNYYLLKSGLHPMFIGSKDKKAYFDGLAVYHSTEYELGAISTMLSFYLRDNEKELAALVSAKKKEHEKDLPLLAFSDTLLLLANSIDEKTIAEDIERLYLSNGTFAKISALWLISESQVWNEGLVDKALVDQDARIRSMALFAIESVMGRNKSEFDRYCPKVQEISLKDTDYNVRADALYMLGRRGEPYLNRSIIKESLEKEKNASVITQVLNSAKNAFGHSDSVEFIAPLLKHESLDVRVMAYQAFIMGASSEDILKVLRNTFGLKKDEKTSLIKTLAVVDNSNGGSTSKLEHDEIAKLLSRQALDDKELADRLLYYLSLRPEMNEEYVRFAEKILDLDSFDDTEKAYATYSLGKTKGQEYLKSKYGLRLNKDDSLIKNVAVFLTCSDGETQNIEKVFDIESKELQLVEAVELAKRIGKNEFGAHFLSLCKKRLKSWK